MSVNGGSLKQFVMVSINNNNGVRKNKEKKNNFFKNGYHVEENGKMGQIK